MKSKNYTMSVGIYFRGDKLDPDLISREIGVLPTESQYKGEKKITSTGHEYVAKIGVWALVVDSNSYDISDHIDQLKMKFSESNYVIQKLKVQEAYIDVFVAADADGDGECAFEFQLNKEDISSLEQFGLPVRFKITTGRP